MPQCPVCQATIGPRLLEHLNVHHMQCDCKLWFRDTTALNVHHQQRKQCAAPSCGRWFCSTKALDQHRAESKCAQTVCHRYTANVMFVANEKQLVKQPVKQPVHRDNVQRRHDSDVKWVTLPCCLDHVHDGHLCRLTRVPLRLPPPRIRQESDQVDG